MQAEARSAGLDKAAADKGLTVTTTELIAQTEPLPGVGTSQELSNALFAAKKGDAPATDAEPARLRHLPGDRN